MPAGDPNLKEFLNHRNENQLIVIDFLDYLGIEVIREFIDHIDIVFLTTKNIFKKQLKLKTLLTAQAVEMLFRLHLLLMPEVS